MKQLVLAALILMSGKVMAQTAPAAAPTVSITTINPFEGLKFFGDVRYRYDLQDYRIMKTFQRQVLLLKKQKFRD